MAIYMNYNDKAVKGNVTASGYEDWIEIDNLHFGVGRGITMEAGAMANREASRPSLSELTFSKRLDAASGGLLKASVTGDEGVKVEIHVVQTGANSVEKYAVYKLENVLISSYSTSASAGGPPSESVALSYAKIETELNHADKSNKNPTSMRVGYCLETAKAL
ncbi:Hcp family type VI secretion system effector [Microbulbifer sp. JMSA004]|uniref:Hcp family type VI secretion system effector n=1 Tax=unclassified Microbulbifer TaxID=2619833 RepID=UPI0024AE3536|nr:type VI secretion system tube protein Hcp [Microbulbifer sp. VAAF005]WHI44515.1 type VI secretion system tube protein Hcp [Microbulbifer sp. VAAF005]